MTEALLVVLAAAVLALSFALATSLKLVRTLVNRQYADSALSLRAASPAPSPRPAAPLPAAGRAPSMPYPLPADVAAALEAAQPASSERPGIETRIPEGM